MASLRFIDVFKAEQYKILYSYFLFNTYGVLIMMLFMILTLTLVI